MPAECVAFIEKGDQRHFECPKSIQYVHDASSQSIRRIKRSLAAIVWWWQWRRRLSIIFFCLDFCVPRKAHRHTHTRSRSRLQRFYCLFNLKRTLAPNEYVPMNLFKETSIISVVFRLSFRAFLFRLRLSCSLSNAFECLGTGRFACLRLSDFVFTKKIFFFYFGKL